MLKMKCPHCQGQLTVVSSFAGVELPCPLCGEKFTASPVRPGTQPRQWEVRIAIGFVILAVLALAAVMITTLSATANRYREEMRELGKPDPAYLRHHGASPQ